MRKKRTPAAEKVEMSFLDHLEEFRWRLLYSLIGILIGSVLCLSFVNPLVDFILLMPAKNAGMKLINLKPFGQLMLYFEVGIIIGSIISLPNIFYQFWKFISPALKKNERKHIKAVVIFSTLSFLSGAVFGYFLMLPATLKFAANFGSSSIENKIAISEYFSIVISIILGCGIVFELPMLSFFLTKIGILNYRFMQKYWRHAMIINLFLAAVLSPGTDPVSMIILAIPLILLYEISIFVSKISQKKK